MPMWNAIDVARACRACLAGLPLVIVSASLAEASYGPRTTIGTHYQQMSTTTSTNGIDQGSCTNVNTCIVLFQRVPQHKRLIVQHVSCRLAVGPGELHFGELGTRKGQTWPLRSTVLLPVPTGDTYYWVVSSPIMQLVKSDEKPFIRFEASQASNWNAWCNISGKLLQP
jgi:hypothetical protein